MLPADFLPSMLNVNIKDELGTVQEKIQDKTPCPLWNTHSAPDQVFFVYEMYHIKVPSGACVNGKGPDKPVYLCSLIRVFAILLQIHWIL